MRNSRFRVEAKKDMPCPTCLHGSRRILSKRLSSNIDFWALEIATQLGGIHREAYQPPPPWPVVVAVADVDIDEVDETANGVGNVHTDQRFSTP